MQDVQSKFWTGTSYLDTFPELEVHCDAARWQREKCPSTGRLHWQWMAVFKCRKRLSAIKKIFGNGVHAEAARNPQKAWEYCGKVESRVGTTCEFGKIGKSETVTEKLSKRPVKEVLQEDPSLWRNVRQLRDVRMLLSEPRREQTSCYLFTGDTGRGKTRIVSRIAEFLGDVYWHDGSNWWDGFDSESAVVCDEFRGQWSPRDLLSLINYTPYRVPCKGGYINFNAKTIFLTSNMSLNDILIRYNIDAFTENALKRRIKQIEVY